MYEPTRDRLQILEIVRRETEAAKAVRGAIEKALAVLAGRTVYEGVDPSHQEGEARRRLREALRRVARFTAAIGAEATCYGSIYGWNAPPLADGSRPFDLAGGYTVPALRLERAEKRLRKAELAERAAAEALQRAADQLDAIREEQAAARHEVDAARQALEHVASEWLE